MTTTPKPSRLFRPGHGPGPGSAAADRRAGARAPPVAAEQPTSQEQIDSLQRQIRELKESSVKETASVPADKKPV